MTTFMLQLLEQDPLIYVLVLSGVIVSIVLHELGHALTATWQGDPTPRMLGHLTWDPRIHMGWISLGMAAILGFAFGATPVNPRYFRNRRWGDVMVSFAGPLVNLCLGLACALLLGLIMVFTPELDQGMAGHAFVFFVLWTAALNFVLFGFNMLPVPPFDGFNVFNGFFEFGELGRRLRAAHPWPMFIAIMIVWRLDVFAYAFRLTELIGGGVAFLFGG